MCWVSSQPLLTFDRADTRFNLTSGQSLEMLRSDSENHLLCTAGSGLVLPDGLDFLNNLGRELFYYLESSKVLLELLNRCSTQNHSRDMGIDITEAKRKLRQTASKPLSDWLHISNFFQILFSQVEIAESLKAFQRHATTLGYVPIQILPCENPAAQWTPDRRSIPELLKDRMIGLVEVIPYDQTVLALVSNRLHQVQLVGNLASLHNTLNRPF
mmetsp:Transcript_8385/g.37497  ORF Transcript_8385/g.37497 Transcript_8385/m.37497 type:complete len:214 (-) Transcript_8385:677-1318(-)